MWDNGVRYVDVKCGVREIAGKHDEYAEGAQAGTQRGTILQIRGNVQTKNTGKCSDKKEKTQGNVQTKNTGKCSEKNTGKCTDKNTGKCLDKDMVPAGSRWRESDQKCRLPTQSEAEGSQGGDKKELFLQPSH